MAIFPSIRSCNNDSCIQLEIPYATPPWKFSQQTLLLWNVLHGTDIIWRGGKVKNFRLGVEGYTQMIFLSHFSMKNLATFFEVGVFIPSYPPPGSTAGSDNTNKAPLTTFSSVLYLLDNAINHRKILKATQESFLKKQLHFDIFGE